MSHSRNKVPLGEVLQQAGLVSAKRVKQALKQQTQDDSNLTIGEILANQGQIDPKTADFFAERWFNIIGEKSKQPIGQYLKQAALLNEEQIQTILDEQKRTELKFGELAIAKGWLKQTTVDFFLRYLILKPSAKSEVDSGSGDPNLDREIINEKVETVKQPKPTDRLEDSQRVHEGFLKIKLKLLKLEDRNTYSEKTLERVLLWTGGQSFLTQKLFKLISENNTTLVLDHEIEQIDYLVQTKIIDDWSNNDLGEHFKTIQDRLFGNQQCKPRKLLQLYQQILTETVSIDNSKEQQELLNMGLVVKQQDRLVVANRIYQSVFSLSWVTKKLTNQTSRNNWATAAIEENSTKVVPTPQSREGKDSFWQLRNILLLLASMGLLWIFFRSIAKRIEVRLAFNKGNELLQEKSFERALGEYTRLLDIDSNYYQAWTNRGYALAGLQKYEEMRQSCSTATIIEPTAVYAWNCQGEALHNLRREEEAIVAFDRAIALQQNDPIFLINKSESLRALDKNEESLAAIEEAIQMLEQMQAGGEESVSGELAVALTFLGNHYRKKEQYELALDTYNRALEYSPSYFPAQISKGIVFSQAERYQKAQNLFESILNNSNLTEAQRGQTWFYLGKTLCKSQQTVAGIAALEQAIKFQPNRQLAVEASKQCT